MVCPAGRGAGPAVWGQTAALETDYKEQLRREQAELAARVQDMLDNARIKNQAIDMKTLKNLLHKKTKEKNKLKLENGCYALDIWIKDPSQGF